MQFRLPTEKIFPSEERQQIMLAWLRGIFLEDWLTKALALVIALGLWYGVTSRSAPTTRRIANVPLILQYPEDTEASNQSIDRIDIRVNGDKSRIERLTKDNVAVVVDLSDYKPGDLVVQLKPETVNVELPSGVKLDKIEQNTVSVRLEPRIEKSIEVKPIFTGRLPDGYEILQTVVTPAAVRVRGAASRVNALTDVPTEKIELFDKTGDFEEKQVTVNLLDQNVTVLDAVVDVAVKIGEQRVEKTFAGVKVLSADQSKPKPEVAEVTLFGAKSLLENLHVDDLQIRLETAEDGTVTPRVVLPPDLNNKIEVRQITPSSFTVQK